MRQVLRCNLCLRLYLCVLPCWFVAFIGYEDPHPLQSLRMVEKYDKLLESLHRSVQLSNFQKYILLSHEHNNQLIFNIRTTKATGIPRFNVWRLLLEILPFSESYQEKIDRLEAHRKRWETLRDESKAVPKSAGKEGPLGVSRNPLMKGPIKTEKKETESDSFLTEEIKKDVSRTYQQLEFFQDAGVLKLLSNVLFVWCKANPDVSYKQGMNELLASIVWVYFQEAAPANYQPTNEIQKKYQALNCITHAQADIYVVFEKIMDIQKEMFKENFDSEAKGVINPNSKNNSPILQRIGYLQDHRLKHLDLELYRAMKLQDVKTKTFLLRWIRCMHTREFGLVGSLPIWDSIILEHYESSSSGRTRKQFEFVDAVCLSMFIYMRSRVLTMESTNEILQVYQKYPQLQGEALQELLGLAWSVCEELRNLDGKNSEQSNEKSSNKKSEEKQQRKEQPKQSKEAKKQSANLTPTKKNQTDPSISRNISIDSLQLQALIDKLSQSNSYNENVDSKKLVRSVIQSLQSKLSQ